VSDNRTIYNKLVRDRIPEIIRAGGARCETETVPPEVYRAALLDKLVEEAAEAREAEDADLPTEIADVLEVLDAIVAEFGLSWSAVHELQRDRRIERGGFERRIKLLWTE
jgi:predicted house-cleaning noncanonical NTP pyrophosphatase (MazG superfamily)